MRPKKRILILDSNEDRRGELAYFLHISGYNALPAEFVPDGKPVDLVICYEAPGRRHGTPVLAVASECPEWADQHFNLDWGRVILLEQLRIMTARKRGPRKQSPELQQATA